VWIFIGTLIPLGLYTCLLLAFLGWIGVAEYHPPGKAEHHSQQPPAITESRPEGPSKVDNRAVREAIFAGAVLIRAYREDQRQVERVEKALDLARQSGLEANIRRVEQTLGDAEQRARITRDIYVALVRQCAKDFSTVEVDQGLVALQQQFATDTSLQPLVQFAKLFVSRTSDYRRDGVIDSKRLDRDILSLQP
jgi:hypothetical protein